MTSILRNPYAPVMQKRTGGVNSPSGMSQKLPSKTVMNGSKSVPFGTSSRRPIGDTSLREITEYTYIPDIRKLNAIQTVQLKEERF